MNRQVFQAVKIDYAKNPKITVSIDDKAASISNQQQVTHSSFKGRRITLPPTNNIGFIPHLESDSTLLLNEQFEAIPIEQFSSQQLFHYFEIGYRGTIQPKIYLDSNVQEEESYQQSLSFIGNPDADTARIYFNALAFGYIPHIWHQNYAVAGSNPPYPYDGEILWSRPIALPPRFYRGIRTHSEFQITYKGSVSIQWYLDGESIGTYDFTNQQGKTVTVKNYFPSGTIGHILQYKQTNTSSGGKIYMVETDVTLADLEQQSMRPQAEEG